MADSMKGLKRTHYCGEVTEIGQEFFCRHPFCKALFFFERKLVRCTFQMIEKNVKIVKEKDISQERN